MIQDKEIKQYLIKHKLDKKWRTNQFRLLTGEEPNQLAKSFFEEFKEYDRVACNLNQARYKKIRKCKDFILKNIIEIATANGLKAVFLTLTWSNESLKGSTEEARRKRIRRFLNTIAYNYVCNVDFGKKTEREHYHAVVLLREGANVEKWQKWGFFNMQELRISEKDTCEKVSKYINKLTYHAFKKTTQHEDSAYRAIYKTTI